MKVTDKVAAELLGEEEKSSFQVVEFKKENNYHTLQEILYNSTIQDAYSQNDSPVQLQENEDVSQFQETSSPASESPKFKVVKKSPPYQYTPITHAANTPTRQELNTMRGRLNRHRWWIQMGILIGALGLGSKVPMFIEWYTEDTPAIVQEYIPSEIATELRVVTSAVEKNQASLEKMTQEIQETTSILEKKITEHTHKTAEQPQKTYRRSQTYNQVQPKKTVYRESQKFSPTFAVTQSNIDTKKYRSPQVSTVSYKPKIEETRTIATLQPKKICVDIPGHKKCYSRRTTNLRERQIYRRLAAKLNQ
jgi:hypothetical protein